MNIVDTDVFEFEIIDERENQIEQYQKIFRDDSQQQFCLWVIVKFERLDIMKNYFMSIYKYIRGLNAPISALITDFHLSENENDKTDIIEKFKLFQLNQIIFISQDTKPEELISGLKKAQTFNTIRMKETIFAELDQKEMNQIFDNLTRELSTI